jgi:hypothetical protein
MSNLDELYDDSWQAVERLRTRGLVATQNNHWLDTNYLPFFTPVYQGMVTVILSFIESRSPFKRPSKWRPKTRTSEKS